MLPTTLAHPTSPPSEESAAPARRRGSRLRRACAALLVGTALIAAAPASPADAAVVDRDIVVVDGDRADFGANWANHVWGRPDDGARVTWGNNQSNNDWVQIDGRLTLDSWWGGGCARVTVDLRDGDRRIVDQDSATICGGGFSAAPYTFLDVDSTDTRIQSVRICTSYAPTADTVFTERVCRTRHRNPVFVMVSITII